ncbi:MAG: hypothetical protein NTX03_14425 [Bacteroidetes bacterium]|nr:hypothetical protein [Bacteroidota bacterium]
MRKAFIYLSVASVSFVIFYSMYYYSQFGRLGGGFTADADTLKNTILKPHPYQPSADKNLVFNAGMMLALVNAGAPAQFGGMNEIKTTLPSNISVTYSGVFNDINNEKITAELRTKFPNHPPVEFKNIKKNDALLFSYVFRNVQLPPGFIETQDMLKFHGKKIKSLLYDPAALDESSKDSIWIYKLENDILLKTKTDNNDEAFWYNGNEEDLTTAFKKISTLIAPANFIANTTYKIILPGIDFYLEKTYTSAELSEYFSTEKKYNHIEDRLKIKTTGRKPLSPFADKKETKTIRFDSNCFFYLKRKDAQFPYVAIKLANPEITVQRMRDGQ